MYFQVQGSFIFYDIIQNTSLTTFRVLHINLEPHLAVDIDPLEKMQRRANKLIPHYLMKLDLKN